MKNTFWIVISLLMIVTACSGRPAKKHSTNKKLMTNTENMVRVEVKTSLGDIVLGLYNETPKHRDNFVKLVKEGYYNGVLFHRVIKDFMIQTGDGDSKTATSDQMLGSGDPGYTIEAEFVYPKYFHKKGALAAARTADQVNPERRSSGSQFYIVTGKVYKPEQLSMMEKQMASQQMQDIFQRLASTHRDEIKKMMLAKDTAGVEKLRQEIIAQTEVEAAKNPAKFTEEQKKAYTTVGGTPHLDGQYTVFGEILSGMNVVDAIQSVETGKADRPKKDIKVISMKILK